MEDAVWVRLQATCRCQACSETTAVNAAVEQLICDGCGAEYGLRADLWDNILAEARTYAASLDANATTQREFDAGTATLTLAIAAVDAACPHCDEGWTALPDGSCPACGIAVSVRGFGPGSLVGEDPHMLAGARADVEPQTMSCSGCGAPLVSDGSVRKIVCDACRRESVVPDEIWRRVHAPRSVASWWLWAGGERTAGLNARVRVMDMVGGVGVVYVLGGYGETFAALFAIGVEPLGLRWMTDLQPLGRASLNRVAYSAASNRLFAYSLMSRSIEVFDAASGDHVRTIAAGEPLQDLAPDPDGTLVGRTAAGALVRIDAQGQVAEPWGSRGLLSKLFGGSGIVEGAPKQGMRGFEDGRIGMGLDGELRVASRRWLGQLARDGDLRWAAEIEVPGANTTVVAPAAAADGTTFAVVRTVGGTMTVEQLEAFTEALADGVEQSSSMLVRVAPGGGAPTPVRPSGPEEFNGLAVTAEGEQWLATGDGELFRLAPTGELVWRQAVDD